MPNSTSTHNTYTGTYKKLRDDSYGAKVNALAENVQEGDEIRVTKRSGQVVSRYVRSVLFNCTHFRTGEPTGQCVVTLKNGRSQASSQTSQASSQETGRSQTSQASQDVSQADFSRTTRSHNDPLIKGMLAAFENMPTDVLRSLLVEGRIILDRKEPSQASEEPLQTSEEPSEEESSEEPSQASEEASEETTVVVEEKPKEEPKKPDLDSIFNDLMF